LEIASAGAFAALAGGAAFCARTHHAPAKKIPETSSRKEQWRIEVKLLRAVGDDN
jgi:hypothetical protein